MSKPEIEATFRSLREILKMYEAGLVKVHDEPDNYYVDTPHIQPNGKPLFFGAARVGRQHVSFHLMPVYVWPELLDDISPELKRRMQGKSCFNFKRAEPELLEELAALTRRGFERYRDAGHVS